MTDTEQRDIIERLEVAVRCIGGYGGYKGDPTLLADLLDYMRHLRLPSPREVALETGMRKAIDRLRNPDHRNLAHDISCILVAALSQASNAAGQPSADGGKEGK